MRLKGLHRVRTALKGGKVVTYHYAWRGGPRLTAAPGSPEFLAQFAAASRARAAQLGARGDDLGALAARYRKSPEFERLADSTRAEWGRWLTRIEGATIATLTRPALEDPGVRAVLIDWRDTYAATPRAADYGMQVLGRLLAWAKGRGLLTVNHGAQVEHLHQADRADQVWTAEELARFEAHASPALCRALRLACLTGLRRGDLVRVERANVGETAIVITAAKNSRAVTVPILPETRILLAELADQGPLLRNTLGQPWTEDGLTGQLIKARDRAGLTKRLHDARGTFATRLRHAGLTRDEIAAVMGWVPDRVERILARYVDNAAIVRRIAERLKGA